MGFCLNGICETEIILCKVGDVGTVIYTSSSVELDADAASSLLLLIFSFDSIFFKNEFSCDYSVSFFLGEINLLPLFFIFCFCYI